LVGNTLSTIEKNRRCWRMIGGVLVEKDLETVKKDLDTQIINVNNHNFMIWYYYIIFLKNYLKYIFIDKTNFRISS